VISMATPFRQVLCIEMTALELSMETGHARGHD
jgi:hypothetical protein